MTVVTTESDHVEEEATWTAGTSIGRVLAQFMQSGMEFGQEHADEP